MISDKVDGIELFSSADGLLPVVEHHAPPPVTPPGYPSVLPEVILSNTTVPHDQFPLSIGV